MCMQGARVAWYSFLEFWSSAQLSNEVLRVVGAQRHVL